MNQEIGIAVKVGCSYKGDLGATHKKCDETWFPIIRVNKLVNL